MPKWLGLGISSAKDPFHAAREAAVLAKAQIEQEKIDLAFVFASAAYNPENIIRGLRQIMPEVKTIGCSAASIITSEGAQKHSLAVLAIKSENIKYGLGISSNLNEKDPRIAGEELAKTALSNLKSTSRDLFIMFSDGLMKNSSNFILGVEDVLGKSFPIIGAAASDDFRFSKTYQYYQNNAFTNAAVGILLGGVGSFGFGIKHGWRPIGKPRLITNSEGNIIKEIDNQPAINMYKDYFGEEAEELREEKLSRIAILYPLGINIPGEEELVLRNVLEADEDGSLVCQGDIPVNSQVNLMLGSKDFCIEAAKQAAREAKKGLKNKPASLIIIFDSTSRLKLLGRIASEEIHAIKETLGKNIPVVGFYGYGEIAPLKAAGYRGASYFHNETVAILAIA